MQKTSYLVIVALVSIVILGVVYSQFSNLNPSNQTQTNESSKVNQSPLKALSFSCQPGESAFEALQKNSQDVKFQGSSFGRMITSINGVNQGNGKYWLYSIDGKDATVSADAYLCQGNEKLEWELR